MLAVSPGWSWREPELPESGRRRPGYRFEVPVSIGSHEFDSLDSIGNIRPASINAVSVVPGVEVEWPMSERWSLKALGFVGLGVETGSDAQAEIFRFGFRSQLAFDLDDTRMFLVNRIGRIGYSADDGSSDAINLVSTGLDFGRPLENKRLGDDPLSLHWHVMYTDYVGSLGLDLSGLSLGSGSLSSEWELGVAFAKQNGPLRFWRLRFDRLGLAYRFSSDHEFKGIGVVFRSLFDQ